MLVPFRFIVKEEGENKILLEKNGNWYSIEWYNKKTDS
jgi:hypothetical protein